MIFYKNVLIHVPTVGSLCGWIDGWICRRYVGYRVSWRINGWIDGWICRRYVGCRVSWRIKGWIDMWMDGLSTFGRVDGSIGCLFIFVSTIFNEGAYLT